MANHAPKLQQISSGAELDAVLAQVKAENQTGLVLLGPGCYVAKSSDDWPEMWHGQQIIYHLNILVHDLAERLQTLTNIRRLILKDNRIGNDGARALTELSQLTTLDLSRNNIGNAGAKAIANLTGLTSLDLSDNMVGNSGVSALSNLTQLTTLDLSHNQIDEAGVKTLSNISRLTTLSLVYNRINDAGAKALSNFSQLTSLNLYANQVGDEGAYSLSRLTQLTTLDLSRNQISDKGLSALTQLKQLSSLYLRNNTISDTGTNSIEKLTQLNSLDLSNNQIGNTSIKTLTNLTKLTALNLRFNRVSDEGVKILGKFTQLHTLDLAGNQISNDAGYALASLTELTVLDLSYTKINDLTPISSLKKLTSLNISITRVSDLSPVKHLFTKGIPIIQAEDRFQHPRGILVFGCPLVHPSPEIIEQGNVAVLNYFRELEAQGVDFLFEAKVLIVGEGGAGKTSLLRRLYQPGKPLPKEDETTKGIEICSIEFQLDSDHDFRLNVWDFGGQQIYHATHQFFLTKRSLYILVDDTRKDHKSVQDEGFKYWLEVIEVLTENSPVLIFQNEKGGRSKTIDESGIKNRFSNIKNFYRGNLENPNSVNRLRKAIQHFVQELPHIGEEVPAKWVAIRTAIEAMTKIRPHISQHEYFDIYAQHLEFDRDKALHLSRYLHDLGVFLHFQDDWQLRNTVILQNRWATEAVFRVLDDETVKNKLGRFDLNDCDRIWADSKYNDVHRELLALMEKFELCYRLIDMKPDTWLAPQLLNPSETILLYKWERLGDMVLCYRYEFMPKGIISRLIVRLHRFVIQPDLAWINGVLFEHEGTCALVKATERGNEILIRARGTENNALLSVIASELDALNKSYRGLDEKVQKWVPCICSQCRASTSPEFFEHKRLVKRKQDNRLKVECPASYENVSVLELLDGIKSDLLPVWAQKQAKDTAQVRTIKIFLASSEELKDDRNEFDLYFRQQNDLLRKQSMYLEIIRWEHFLDAMSDTRLQDEYNKKVRDCDIFVSLFKTRTGKFTEEEFDVAHTAFIKNGNPLIYTYFNPNFNISEAKKADIKTLWAFQEKLSELGHFHTKYDNVEHLKRQFRDQLDMLFDEEKL
ncbi:MAG: ADP-ribosylation factor-like protein [Gammaproteobacteria bacterium]|nr:ADP-ribosylation factor-like protein [Gammaproteobacteria bacterium]MDH5652242.1 ADP-ribosylation factor-like protein [Gammaproteobacteria bacterium]